jgi:hypothetical protein
MSSPLLAACGLAALALLATSAPAYEDVTATGAVRAEYLQNTGVDASALDARVDLDLGVGPLTLGVVYRAYQLSDPSYNPASIDVPDAAIKHRYVEYNEGPLSARAGHVFATFGHGLTLRSYEDVDLEHDTLLDGLSAEYRAGAATVTALAGAVREDLFGKRYRDHVVRAARVSVPVGGWAELAASGAQRARTEKDEEIDIPESVARFDDAVSGGEVTLWLGPVTLTGEYAGRNGSNPVTALDVIRGHATYASGTADLGFLTLFGEFKDYVDFDDYLVNPPTCVREHVWTLMNRATYEIDLNDERGFLGEGSAAIGDALYLTGGASEARRHSGALSHWEMYGQLEHSFWDALGGSFAGAWSREYELGKFTEHVSGGAEFVINPRPDQSMEVLLEGQRTEDISGLTYNDYLWALTFYPGSDITFTTTFETTTDESETRDLWNMVEVRSLLPDDLELTLGMGTQRGGKTCSGGICFFEPEFEGLRLRLAKYF